MAGQNETRLYSWQSSKTKQMNLSPFATPQSVNWRPDLKDEMCGRDHVINLSSLLSLLFPHFDRWD